MVINVDFTLIYLQLSLRKLFKEASSKPRGFGGGVKTFSIKNCLGYRMDTQMVSFDSPTLREHFKYLV